MMNKSKTLISYISTLPLVGSVVLIGGIVASYNVLQDRHPEDWSANYFYFKALGAILGYLWVSRGNPGGLVTINLDKSKQTEDEKALDELMIKNRSNTLMVLPLILYIIADYIIGRTRVQTYTPSYEGYIISMIIGSFITLTTTMGVKYLSAWWNIRKNMDRSYKSETVY